MFSKQNEITSSTNHTRTLQKVIIELAELDAQASVRSSCYIVIFYTILMIFL